MQISLQKSFDSVNLVGNLLYMIRPSKIVTIKLLATPKYILSMGNFHNYLGGRADSKTD